MCILFFTCQINQINMVGFVCVCLCVYVCVCVCVCVCKRGVEGEKVKQEVFLLLSVATILSLSHLLAVIHLNINGDFLWLCPNCDSNTQNWVINLP